MEFAIESPYFSVGIMTPTNFGWSYSRLEYLQEL